MSLLVALTTVLGFTVIDHWLLVGPRLVRRDIWRFGLQLPPVLIMLVLTTPRLYLRWYQSCWASHSTRRCAATCEEIIAILVGSDRAEAACSAEGVRRALTDLGIAHSASGTRAYVTVSTGVTTVEPGGDYSHERAVRLADVALYATKARPGRLVLPCTGG
jgi:Diguanylate cyclase, GGDEF domain